MLFIVYLLVATVTIVSTILTTKSDPTDPTVAAERHWRTNWTLESDNKFSTAEFEFFCAVCNTHVMEDSKHCKMCNRCTQ